MTSKRTMKTPGRRAARAGRRPPRRGKVAMTRWLPAVGVALLLALTGAVTALQFPLVAPRAVPSRAPGVDDVARALATIPPRTWDRVGADDAVPPLLVGAPPRTAGRPLVLYVGAEYCSYCAALRWSLAAALDRFGTLSGLALSASSATDAFPRTPAVTTLEARYESPYVAVQTVELQGNARDASGRYPPLQHLTSRQNALFRRYDPPGNIPFLLIGEQYLFGGEPFSPGLLAGVDWYGIAAALADGTTPGARAIVATANEIAAAICIADGNAPGGVCRSAGVRDAAQTLPRAGN